MFGTLRRIEITEDLIMEVAREQYARCNEGILNDQSNYVKGMWLNGSCDILDGFNELVEIFKKINFKCDVGSFGRGPDVNEFYRSNDD